MGGAATHTAGPHSYATASAHRPVGKHADWMRCSEFQKCEHLFACSLSPFCVRASTFLKLFSLEAGQRLAYGLHLSVSSLAAGVYRVEQAGNPVRASSTHPAARSSCALLACVLSRCPSAPLSRRIWLAPALPRTISLSLVILLHCCLSPFLFADSLFPPFSCFALLKAWCRQPHRSCSLLQ